MFEKAVTLLAALEHSGYEARIVGGAVRDYLSNRPVNDIDIATTALPHDVVTLFESNGLQVIPTGLQHGTVTVVYEDEKFEITTLRLDVETDGRHAEVRFTSDWKADASRRDFTFNAMSMDREGNVYDYFDGRADLENRRVRFIGDPYARITEDYLRILRFVRFCADFECNYIDADALLAIRQFVPNLSQISEERILVEIAKTAQKAKNPFVFEFMNGIGISQFLFGRYLNIRNLVLMGDWELTLRSMDVGTGFFVNYKASNASMKLMDSVIAVDMCWALGDSIEWLHYKYGHQIVQKAAKLFRRTYYEPAMRVPVRPFNGNDVMKAFPDLKGKDIGQRLDRITARWCESGFTKTFEQLIKEFQ